MDRIAALEEFVKKDPDDPFPRYGLAMAYREAGRHDEAQDHFEVLLAQFPEYIAAYLMAGGNLVSLGRHQEAAEVYRRGVEAASRAGDAHARSELEAALAELEESQ
jgi:tetratricopeptide (TPR) repeat protein